MNSLQSQNAVVENQSLDWVKRVVVGLNLCPFANHVVKSGDLHLHTETSDNPAIVLATFAAQCDQLIAGAEESTLLLILPNGFQQFDAYLDLVDYAQALLEDLSLDGLLQIATFHPHYQFNETEFDDAANYTNRSPYPMLHVLQEKAVEKAVLQHPDTALIPERNIELLRSMNSAQIAKLINPEDGQS